jgi:GT2 family glycosyltransferase
MLGPAGRARGRGGSKKKGIHTIMESRVTVVIVTRDRLASLRETLERLRGLPESPRVVVVDNGSSDGTVERLRVEEGPELRVIALGENRGAASRNFGVEAAGSPYVAFCDDDSWWGPGALSLAADRFDGRPRLGLLAARVVVEPSGRTDPTCEAMATSPLVPRMDLPGPPVLGFLACGAVVRRSAFLEVGGFEARFGVGGEEELLALDLASAGWGLAYCEEVVAHHRPTCSGPRPGRRRVQSRNALWSAWLRRAPLASLRVTAQLAARGVRDPDVRAGFREALGGLGWVLTRRRPVPREVERDLRALGL